MVLNETAKSGWGWAQNSLVNIDRNNGTVTYNPDYNVMSLISRIIKPGDQRIASSADRTPILSVKDKDGTIKIIVQNDRNTREACRVRLSGKEYTFALPPRAIAAIILK